MAAEEEEGACGDLAAWWAARWAAGDWIERGGMGEEKWR
jgi:hypothetical protein